MTHTRTELLAPAGSLSCLHAAVASGADAVYLGVDSFNARRGADNFTLETLEEACDYAHLRGVSVYLALNIVVLPQELNEAVELARQAYRMGVDAFILQDIGLVSEIRRVLPDAQIHCSTQMNIHSRAGIDAVSTLGVQRVTLARELSLSEIDELSAYASQQGLEIEVFAHGALCISYSGQCFMSSMIGGRSANRGLCAQACRLPYTLHNKALRKNLPAPGEHLLSPKDINSVELIPHLVESGVASIKIEGRMKSSDYVSSVTAVYRRALDKALAGGDYEVAEEDELALEEVFSRGFTTAYLESKRGNEIMSYGRPNNRGVFVGRVVSVHDGLVSVEFEQEISKGDKLEFWTNKGHFTHELTTLDRDKQGRLRLTLSKPVGKGDRVFRVRNAQRVFSDDPYLPLIPVTSRIELIQGKPLRLSVGVVDADIQVVIEGPLVEPARTKAVTAEEIREHIDRFGNTDFVLEELEIECDEGVGIGFSQLHKIRSQALNLLREKILEPYKQRVLQKSSPPNTVQVAPKQGCIVTAWATNPACARAAKRAGAEVLYVPALNYKRGQATIVGQVSDTVESAGYPKQSIITLPVVSHDLIQGSREYALGEEYGGYLKADKSVFVENLGQLFEAFQNKALPEVGPHLPILNKASLQVVAAMNAKRVWLSPELSLTQIEELSSNSPVPLGLIVAGRQELMTTEHCLLMSQGACNEDCATCSRPKSPHYLRDRKGYEFPVVTDKFGRSHLYNAVEFDVAHAVPDLIRSGITALMVDTAMMTVAETTKAVERMVRARDIALKSGDRVSKREGATTGHLYRGVS